MSNNEKLFCSKCYKNFEGQKITKLNNLPNILIIVLKRLLYNKDSSTKIKNNEYLEFPFTLDLCNYNYLNDTIILNNDIITEYILKEIVIH
jgi:ubiquitin C-terminal hydrolase